MDLLRRTLSRLASLWRNLRHRDGLDADLDAEVRAAFDLFVEEQIQKGVPPGDARRLATVHLGRIESVATQVRDTRAGAGLDTLWHDVRFGSRLLQRNPLFTFTAVLSLALGIGATTTMFSVVNALLLRDVRVAAPRELVELWRTTQFGSGTAFSYPAYEALRDQNATFTGVLALSKSTIAGSTGSAAQAAGRFVSGNFFEVLGLAPVAGRLLSARDDRPDAPGESAVAIVSHRFWQREFGGGVAALGAIIRIDAVRFTIVGVLPASFDDLVVGRPADFFIPMGSEPLVRRDSRLRNGSASWLGVVGRLRPGASADAAEANLAPIFARFMADMAGTITDKEAQDRLRAQRLFLQPGRLGVSDVRRDFSRPVLLLMGAVSLVLVIAGANVVNLLLARGVTRRREIGLRLAIGASRWRLIRQLLTESALLGGAGAALGLVIATLGAPLVLALVSENGSPITLDVAPDLRILLFTVSVALASSLLAGVLPALRTAGTDITPSFQPNPRSLSVTRDSTRWGHLLIGAQVALSLVLVVGAVLLVASLRNIKGFNPGFDAGQVVLLKIDPTRVGYQDAALTRYYHDLLGSIRALPGVTAASLSSITPLSGGGIDLPITIEGRPREPGVMITVNRMSDGFFPTMAIPIRLGRDFIPGDEARANAVAIVNDAFVQRYFKNENPIGRRFMLRGPDPLEIVGLVANSKYYSLREADKPTVYLYAPAIAEPGGVTLSVRTAGDPQAFARVIQDRMQAVAASVPVLQVRTLSSQVDRSLVNERLIARLLSAFAIMALVLASVGLYGVLGYSVARRTGEIGLRLALGATRAGVLRSVLRQSLIVVALGSAAGVAATTMLSRPLAGLLYGVTSSDPKVLAGVVACLFAVAIAAAAIPAWRAARVDPLVALRQD